MQSQSELIWSANGVKTDDRMYLMNTDTLPTTAMACFRIIVLHTVNKFRWDSSSPWMNLYEKKVAVLPSQLSETASSIYETKL